MDVYMLSITICISFLFETSLSMKCAESIPTISTVSRCPSNATEWDIAAKRKSCNVLAKIQNCTHANNFVYHCVLNEEATMLVEVCAPIYYLAEYCSRYSEIDGKFINKPDLDCTVFDPPCPNRFSSNESYKYQKCYEKVIKQQQEKNSVNQYVPLVTVLAITITLLMVLAVGFKLKWIKCLCGKKHKSTEVVIHVQEKENVHTEKMVKECKNLTGSTKVTCALQASSAILDLRNALSKELNIPQTLILIVDQENGTIFQDDIEIETLKQSPIEFILGNRNRTSIIEDDGSVENNVISNKNITYGKCKMSCGHFTDPETLFVWTKEKLPGGLHSGLPCPRCPYMLWGIDELVEKCNMSPDEIIFFKNVAILNKRTVGMFDEFESPKPQISVSKLQTD
nr:uncharacterized protein LOC105326182 [Crassostrea gigas]XP_034335714.1 uncharacterized protein LOC105326182 [Crassostrea gigas]